MYYVNDISQDKEALLHHAARQGFSDVVQVLLDKGVEVNVVDNVSYIILSYHYILHNNYKQLQTFHPAYEAC